MKKTRVGKRGKCSGPENYPGYDPAEDAERLDGINERGLSVGSFYFPGFAGYSVSTP